MGARPRVLFVAHGGIGGIARHMEDLAALAAPDAETWLLQPHGATHLHLRDFSPHPAWRAWPHRSHWARVVAWLRDAGIDRVHYHHVHGLPPEVLELPAQLGASYDITLHDYYPVCSRYHMVDGSGGFCGGEPGCRRCEEQRPDMWGLGIDAWRAAFAPWLAAAGRLIVPSGDAARRVRAHAPASRPEVWPHPEASTPVRPTLRVLLLGALSPEKGVDVLEACIADATARDLPLHFRLIGLTSRPLAASTLARFSLTGEYAEGDLDRLIEHERGDAVLFLARCPETYSYTLSAALRSRLPIVAPDLGAFSTRLAGRESARLFPWNAAPATINDALLALPVRAALAPDIDGASTAVSYRERYLAAMRAGAARERPPLPHEWAQAPAEGPSRWTLEALFDDGVLCGRASSRVLLRERCVEADGEIPVLRSALAAAQEEARRNGEAAAQARAKAAVTDQALASEKQARADAEALLQRMESSQSWRLTAPLRALRRLMRRPA